MKVLVVPDKFKGTLTAEEAARSLARGWLRARPADPLEWVPMSDGGDGFGAVLSRLLGAEGLEIPTVDAAHRPRLANWWLARPTRTALIESAQIIGLALLPPGRFHPLHLDTFGLGAVVRAAQSAGARRAVFGIGGSSTNDGGFGLARALGWDFLDGEERPIARWPDLVRLEALRPPAQRTEFEESLVAVDVQNPLLGPRGATRVYGPQKGLRLEDYARAEEALGRLAEIAERALGMVARTAPGAGAAGGLGFGLRMFLGARLEPGFQVFAKASGLEKRIGEAELVLTGEGMIDHSTMMGKGVGEVARLCQLLHVPCIGFSGRLSDSSGSDCFRKIYSMAPGFADLETAQKQPAECLERLAAKAGAEWDRLAAG